MKPREANTNRKLSSLKRDNKSFGKVDILVHEDRVSIWPENKTTDGWIVISKRDFNRMIDWYNQEQSVQQ